MTTWAFNRRTKITHAVDSERRTLCGWWAGRMLPVEAPPDVTRLCYECYVKLRDASGKRDWRKPVAFRHDKRSFVERVNKAGGRRLIQSIALEAAQKGYWGIV